MTQGIRDFTNETFFQLLPSLPELGNPGFRKVVMQATVAQFGISVASAATHYNHSLKAQREVDPSAVKSLGRPEDKKGGRKVVHCVDVIKVKTGEVVATGVSKATAQSLIATAEAKRKAKLAIRVEAVAEVVAEPTAPVAESVAA